MAKEMAYMKASQRSCGVAANISGMAWRKQWRISIMAPLCMAASRRQSIIIKRANGVKAENGIGGVNGNNESVSVSAAKASAAISGNKRKRKQRRRKASERKRKSVRRKIAAWRRQQHQQ
jgi:hypothetical protein